MTGATIRCAIYTRKSSDEGLDQHFNSLDAQHEACAAYIASQRHEGWRGCRPVTTTAGYPGAHSSALPFSGSWTRSTLAGSTWWSSTRSTG
jgi:hypothetical protein